MPPVGFSAATVLDEVRAGGMLQAIADAHSMDEIVGAVRDALTGLRLGVSSLDEAALHRIAGLELWSIAEIAGHTLTADLAAHAIARSLALGRAPSDARFPYGVAGDPAATREALLAGIRSAEERLAGARVLAAGGPTFAHDELGELTARGWILFSGLHAAVHLHQAAAVMRAR
ncbi:MAG TPA: DinB family protein [Candidatus Limnocylindria bacterium]